MIWSHRVRLHALFPAGLSASSFDFEQSTGVPLHVSALGDGDSTDEVFPWGAGLAQDASRLQGPQSSMIPRLYHQWSICHWDFDFQILSLSPADQLSLSFYSVLSSVLQRTLNPTSLPDRSVLTRHTRWISEQAAAQVLSADRWPRRKWSSTKGVPIHMQRLKAHQTLSSTHAKPQHHRGYILQDTDTPPPETGSFLPICARHQGNTGIDYLSGVIPNHACSRVLKLAPESFISLIFTEIGIKNLDIYL